jgi:DME family drug/metabolite transporter
LFGVFGVALLEGSYVLAVDAGGAALASILLYSAPIWVNLAGVVIFREKIPAKRWASLAVTFSGVVGICLWGATVAFTPAALIWGLLSGLSYAGFYIAGKVFFRRIHPTVVYMIAFPIGSLAILPFMCAITNQSPIEAIERFGSFPAPAIIACLAMGWFCTYLPYLLYGAGLRLMDAGRAAIITMVEPLVSVGVAILLWGESFSIAGYFFAALVLVGVAIS